VKKSKKTFKILSLSVAIPINIKTSIKRYRKLAKEISSINV